MNHPLAPCPSCSRHIKTTESSCPFCKRGVAKGSLVAIPGTTQRLSRAAAYAFTASLAVTGCGSEASTPAADAGASDGSVAKDGATSGDAATGSDASATKDAGDASTTSDGSTMNDASTSDAAKDSATFDDGGNQPPYGVPAYGGPFVDGGGD